MRHVETFEELVRRSPFGVYVVDAEFRLVLVSKGARKVFQHVRPLIGRDFAEVLRAIWVEPFASDAIALFRHTLETGEPFHTNRTLERRADTGEIESYDWQIERITLPDGQYGVVCHFYDLSERARYDEALREQEERLRLALEAADLGTWDADIATRTTRYSEAVGPIFGMPRVPFSLTYDEWASHVHPEDLPKVLQAFQALVERDEPYRLCSRVVRPDGSIRWVEVNGAAIRDRSGQPLRAIGVIADVTESRASEESLRESEERFRQLADTLDSIFYITEGDGVKYVSPAYERIWGRSREELLRDPRAFLLAVMDEDRPRVLQALQRQAAGEATEIEYRVVDAAGNVHRVRDRAFPSIGSDGKLQRVFGVVEDVTEARRAQSALEDQLRITKTIADNADSPLMLLDRNGYTTYANPAFFRVTGYSVEDTWGKTAHELIHYRYPDGRPFPIEECPIDNAYWKLQPARNLELTFVRKDGTLFPVVAHVAPLKDEKGVMQGGVLEFRDVTEEQARERALRESEAKLSSIVESVQDALYAVDRDYRFVLFNPHAEAFFGMKKEDVLGRNSFEVFPMTVGTEIERALRAAMEEERAQHLELRSPATGKWVELHMYPWPEGVSLFIRDMTARKEAEDALRASEAYNRAIFDNIAVGVANASLDGQWIKCNDALCRMLGYTREELLTLRTLDVTHPDDAPTDRELMRKLTQGEMDHYSRQKRYVRKDGSIFWGNVTVALMRDASGNPQSFVGVIEDITDRIETEQSLRESVRRYHALSTATASLVWGTDATGMIDDIPDWREITGQTREEVQGYGWLDAIHPDDREATAKAWQKAYESRSLYDVVYRLKHRDGTYRWVNARGVPVMDDAGRLIEWVGVVEDVHEERVQAQALQQSEAQYRQIAEGLPEIVWSSDAAGKLTFVNQRLVNYTGRSAASLLAGWLDVIHPDDRPVFVADWERAVLTGQLHEIEMRLRRHDGQYRWFLSRAIALRDEQDNIFRWFGTCTDIHDQKATQHALEMSNRFATTLAADLDLERIVQALCDASTSAIHAEFGSFFYNVINEQGEALLLYTLSGAPKEAFERFGMPRATHVFAPTFRGEGIVRSDDITRDPRYGQMGPHYGMPKGHLPVVSYLAVPVVSRSGEVIGGLFFGHSKPAQFSEEHERIVSSFAAQAAVAIDNARLYERLKRLNEELERRVQERTVDLRLANQQLEGFTYHVSHDLRAPLRAIIATSRLLEEEMGERLTESASGLLRRQIDSANKLGKLIDDLLKLSRLSRQEFVFEPLDFSRLAQEAAHEALSNYDAAAVTIDVKPSMRAMGDGRLLKLALLNLLDNAIKYSPQGGRVEVGQREDGTFFVSDQGIGMEPQYLERIFEPFQRLHRDTEFEGTGIGLANVRQVIERHGGRVWAESRLGQGSTFFFTLS